MKKKTKRFLTFLLWALIGSVFLALVLAPPQRPVPRAVWRVPVENPFTKLKKIPLSELWDLSPGKRARQSVPPSEVLPTPSSPLPERDSRKGSAPRIAIIIDDMGLSHGALQRILRLPAAVTLSFLPYAPDLSEQTAKASQAGHELLLHLPMEPLGKESPGPNALMTSLPLSALQERIDQNLDRFSGYVGVNNHMGSKFTQDRERMKILVDTLNRRELFFVDSRTSPRSVGLEIAKEAGLKSGARDIFLDDLPTEDEVIKQLERLERIARDKGEAIAIGHPHASTLKPLENWLLSAEDRGFKIVPVGQLVR